MQLSIRLVPDLLSTLYAYIVIWAAKNRLSLEKGGGRNAGVNETLLIRERRELWHL